jgi:hypothetical protein
VSPGVGDKMRSAPQIRVEPQRSIAFGMDVPLSLLFVNRAGLRTIPEAIERFWAVTAR